MTLQGTVQSFANRYVDVIDVYLQPQHLWSCRVRRAGPAHTSCHPGTIDKLTRLLDPEHPCPRSSQSEEGSGQNIRPQDVLVIL